MTLAVTHNAVAATNARQIGKASDLLGAAQQRLASGSRVVDPSFDATGTAVGAILSSDVSVLEQASRNAAIGTAVTEFMIGALSTQMDILSRMRALAGQAISDSIGNDDQRALVNIEFQDLVNQLDKIATNAKWLGTDLLSTSSTALDFVVGLDEANKVTTDAIHTDKTTLDLMSGEFKAGDFILATDVLVGTSSDPIILTAAQAKALTDLGIEKEPAVGGPTPSLAVHYAAGNSITSPKSFAGETSLSAVQAAALNTLGITGGTANINISTKEQATDSLTKVTDAIDTVANHIASVGAKKAELKYAAENVGVEMINKASAKSTIVDADVTGELQNVQTQKALFDMSSAMFSKSLKKQDDLAQMVKNA